MLICYLFHILLFFISHSIASSQKNSPNIPFTVVSFINAIPSSSVILGNMRVYSDKAREYMKNLLPQLSYWKEKKNLANAEKFEAFRQQLIDEFNTLLHIEGLPKVEDLNVLSGEFINMEYTLPNGEKVKFLDDKQTYLGSQLEGETRCYGIAANMDFLLVCSYEENGENPELVIYKKR